MKKKIRMLAMVIVFLVALVILAPVSGVVLALDNQDVTITAVPSYICITNAPGDWTVNEYDTSVIDTSTEYWSNPIDDVTTPSDPVVDGECRFTITNTSSVITKLTVNFVNFTGGDAMANSDDGSGGVGTFGAYSYCTEMTYTTGKVIAKVTGSDPMKENLAATTDIKWGLSCDTQTDVWTSGDAMTSTATITATAQ